jgi:hypothetical protein
LGLAKAPQFLNEIVSNVDAPRPGNQDSTAFSLEIKPSGILVFFDEKSRYGTLKFGEFGSASVKEDVLSVNMYDRPSTPMEATKVDAIRTYETPERDSTGFPSRSAEIWSLRCVFTELLMWALRPFPGKERIISFYTLPCRTSVKSTSSNRSVLDADRGRH